MSDGNLREANPATVTQRPVASAGEAQLDSPAYTSAQWDDMEPFWRKCRDLMRGTEGVLARPQEYLPRHPVETPQEYEGRLKRTECSPLFKVSVAGLTGIACRTDPVLGPDAPPDFTEHWEDLDGDGTHGAVFVRELLEDALTTGLAGILVDVPVAGAELSLADEQTLGVRPYWVHVRAEQILSARWTKIAGKRVLSQLVLAECVPVAVGEFMTEDRDQWRVFRLDLGGNTPLVRWELWQMVKRNRAKKPEMTKVDEGTVVGVERIPFAPVVAGPKKGPLWCRPPLVDLAYTNVAHLRVKSDHRHSLHIASVPLLVFKGRDTTQQAQAVGPNTGIDIDKEGDVKYVEHAGTALSATRTELLDLERVAALQGLAMLQNDTRVAETAEAKRIDKSQKDANLSSVVRAVQDALEQAATFHLQFMGLEEKELSIELSRKFNTETLDPMTIQTLSSMVTAGQLSLETLWELLVKGDVLPEDFDADVELLRILNGSPEGQPDPTPNEFEVSGSGGGDGSKPPADQKTSTAPDNRTGIGGKPA